VTTGNSDLQGSRHFWPPLGQALIPKKQFDLLWHSVTGRPHEFQRGDGQRRETLRVDIFFRLLNPATNKYVGALHCFRLLEGMDPNDKTWKDKYNGTINQWRLRQDAVYVKLLSWGDGRTLRSMRSIHPSTTSAASTGSANSVRTTPDSCSLHCESS